MTPLRLVLLPTALAIVLTVFPAAANMPSAPPIRGVVLTLTMEDRGFSYTPFIREIRDLGATHVSLLLPWYLEDAESTRIYEHPRKTPTETQVRETLAAAREAGLQTMLLPIVLLEDDTSDDWRGTLRPRDTDQWYSSYADLLLPLARLAEEHNVALFSIGSELASLEKHDTHWRTLASRVRTVYTGQLLYTANWDTPDRIAWWDAVDAIGISAYFELANPGEEDAPVQELAAEAAFWRDWLLRIHRDIDPAKPLIFSEIGFPSLDGGAVLPWDYTQPTGTDLEEQRRGWEATIHAWGDQPALHGLFVYTWMDFGGDPDRGYSPRGKPTEELLRRWFATPFPP